MRAKESASGADERETSSLLHTPTIIAPGSR